MRSKKPATAAKIKRAVHQHEAAQHPGQPKTRIKIDKGKK